MALVQLVTNLWSIVDETEYRQRLEVLRTRK
ncbi:hypothetical protein JOF39_001691 [Glutamicibacter protophormiae]|uniref:Uncharacterized protein n=1 Tax=Glutamicibacter protophormiae TaxID=37930 RepID=A0ABS4XQF5_GLUPR|nr:hypothetical protein [Glutamicibacter protophormiae]